MRHAIVVVFLLATTVAASQPPTRKGSQPEANTSQADKPATDDPRGTNASPLIVTVQPTPKTDAETAQEQTQKDDQASDRRWTRGLAIVTTLVGLFQLVAIGFQVCIASRQNEIIKRQNRIMTRQRKAADTQSGYMEAGLKVARDSANAATASADAAKNSVTALIDSDRPWVGLGGSSHFHVRSIANGQILPGQPLTIGFTLTNGGRRPALIYDSKITISTHAVFPDEPEFLNNPNMVGSSSLLMPGALVNSEIDVIFTHTDVGRILRREITIFIYAFIQYKDLRTGAEYWTKICGRYDPSTQKVGYNLTYNDAT